MLQLSNKAKVLKPSPTLALAAKAKEMQAKGLDVVSLTVGEPDWASFKVSNQAGIAAIEAGFTKYTAAAGTVELKSKVAKLLTSQLRFPVAGSDVVIGTGAKILIFAVMDLLMNSGDEVIIPTPYWVSYPMMAEMVFAKPVFVKTDEQSNFKMTAEQLKKAITPKTKMLILCSPSNPTGFFYTEAELKALSEVLQENPHVSILSDDIYNRLVFEGDLAPHILHVAPQLKDRTVVINGASKAYSMTGWRIGWAAGPTNLIKALSDYLSQTTSNACSISQKAAEAAIELGEPELEQARKNLVAKKNYCMDRASKLQKLKILPPQGAFYLWMNVEKTFGKTFSGNNAATTIQGSSDVCQILLEEFQLVTVPGAEFGEDRYVRLSFAASHEDLKKAFDRLERFESGIS